MSNDAKRIVDADKNVQKSAQMVADKVAAIDVCKLNITKAEIALQQANARCEDADAVDDPQKIVDAAIEAELNLKRANVALTVAESQHKNAIKAHQKARHTALDGFFADARKRRMDACEAMDSLRQQLAEAMTKYAMATNDIQSAHNHGRTRPFNGALLELPKGVAGELAADFSLATHEAQLWADAS